MGDGLSLLESVGHHRHVGEPHDATQRRGVAGSAGKGNARDLVQRLKFADGAQRVAVAPLADRAPWGALVGGIDGAEDLIDPDVVGSQQPRIHFDVNLPLQTSGHRRLGDPVDLFQAALEDLLRQILEGPEIFSP